MSSPHKELAVVAHHETWRHSGHPPEPTGWIQRHLHSWPYRCKSRRPFDGRYLWSGPERSCWAPMVVKSEWHSLICKTCRDGNTSYSSPGEEVSFIFCRLTSYSFSFTYCNGSQKNWLSRQIFYSFLNCPDKFQYFHYNWMGAEDCLCPIVTHLNYVLIDFHPANNNQWKMVRSKEIECWQKRKRRRRMYIMYVPFN